MSAYLLENEQATIDFAKRLAPCLKAPLILGFSGEMGTGKTTVIRALLRHLGIDTTIKSPTYTWVETYTFNQFVFHHFDFYRLQDENDLEGIGFRDYFTEDAICCIEWPQRAPHHLPHLDVMFELSVFDEGRKIQVDAEGGVGEKLMEYIR